MLNKNRIKIVVEKTKLFSFPFLASFILLLSINKIIKAELNNIIQISEQDFTYINFANNSNGDMIIQLDSQLGSQKRMFYGLKKKGEYYFEKNGVPTPLYSINSEKIKNRSETFFITVKEDGIKKEYLMSVSMDEHNCELYDFENDNIISKKSSEFLEHKMASIRETSIAFTLEGDNYIFFPYITDKKVIIETFLFNSKNIKNDVQNIKTYSSGLKKTGNSIYCYKCSLVDIFICFYFDIESSKGKYYILVLEQELKKLALESFTTEKADINSFYKCINLKNNVGIFIYYEKYQNKYFPFLKAK